MTFEHDERPTKVGADRGTGSDPSRPPYPDRWRTAYHEAGHAVAALLLLGECPALITIRRTPGYLGACIGIDTRMEFGAHDRDDPLHADLFIRAQAERSIVAILAGNAAEHLVGLPPSLGGYMANVGPNADELQARATADSLERLHPHEQALLRDAEASIGTPSDLAAADELAAQLAGRSGGYLVLYLQAVAERFVARHAEAIASVALALDRHTVIRGTDAQAYVQRFQTEGRIAADIRSHA